MPNNNRLVFIVNHAAFFVSHRLPLALAAKSIGYEVALFTGRAGSEQMERSAVVKLLGSGVSHERTPFRSSGINPFVEIRGLIGLIFLVHRYKPRIIHCASPKGIMYGGIVARMCKVPGLVLAVSGMGYIFTERDGVGPLDRLLKKSFLTFAKFAFQHKNVRVIVQNCDDKKLLIEGGFICPERIILIPGSGVDLELFRADAISFKEQIVIFPARILRDKGVVEFVDAVRKIHLKAPGWRFLLAGAADYENPTAISPSSIKDWQAEGIIEWVGHVEDIAPLFKRASIACLPSYREGMPKALLEAAAAGCAIITTDVTGCREAIDPGVTGDLVPARDAESLADAILSLINDDARRLAYGEAGRKRAESRFSIQTVVDQTLKIYESLNNEH